MKLDYKKTFLIGLAFFSASMIWPIYNTYVPVFLEKYISSAMIIGLIMSFDNIFAVIFQPLFGALSDKTFTRYGRRMPFLLIGVPLAALFFALIPFEFNLASLMIFVIITIFSMSIYRAPAVALMPDMTPSPLRSKANGIINVMGGIASVIAFGVGGILYKANPKYPFFMGSVVMMVAVILLYLFVKEPKEVQQKEETQKASDHPEKKEEGKTLSLIFLLLAIFFWFTGFNAVETFFSLYGKEILGIDPGSSSILLTSFSAAFLLLAIPAGILATRIGRRKTILIGISGALLVFLSIIFIRNVAIIRILLLLGGVFWAAININSYPMIVEMASSKGIGTYTGYYYFFSSSAAIVSPILFGWIKDRVGSYSPLFVYATVGFLLAFFFMMLVKHGEVPKEAGDALEIMEEL